MRKKEKMTRYLHHVDVKIRILGRKGRLRVVHEGRERGEVNGMKELESVESSECGNECFGIKKKEKNTHKKEEKRRKREDVQQ